MKKTIKQQLQEAYNTLPDSGLIPTRKSVVLQINGFAYLIYKKALINKVKHGTSAIVAGYLVIDTFKTEGKDGLVICLPED